MDWKYIFAIVIFGVFFVLIFVSFVILEHARLKERKLRAWISEQYASEDVKKYDYDAQDEDDLIPEENTTAISDNVSETVEDVKEEHFDDSYGKIDFEGIEEITGNYNGDK